MVSRFLFDRMWEMHMTHIILCCFGDKRCEIVGHILKINFFVMTAIFMNTLDAFKM